MCANKLTLMNVLFEHDDDDMIYNLRSQNGRQRRRESPGPD